MLYDYDKYNKIKEEFEDALEMLNVNKSTMSFNNMFEATQKLDLSSFDTQKVTTMFGMFSNCSSLTTLDLSSFDTSKVTEMYNMFANCSSLTTIYVSDKFKTDAVADSTGMFRNCPKLVGGNGTKFDTNKKTIRYTGDSIDLKSALINVPANQKIQFIMSPKMVKYAELNKDTGVIVGKADKKVKVTCLIGEGKNAAKLYCNVTIKTPKIMPSKDIKIKAEKEMNISLKNVVAGDDIKWS